MAHIVASVDPSWAGPPGWARSLFVAADPDFGEAGVAPVPLLDGRPVLVGAALQQPDGRIIVASRAPDGGWVLFRLRGLSAGTHARSANPLAHGTRLWVPAWTPGHGGGHRPSRAAALSPAGYPRIARSACTAALGC